VTSDYAHLARTAARRAGLDESLVTDEVVANFTRLCESTASSRGSHAEALVTLEECIAVAILQTVS